MIEVSALSKRFGAVQALDGIDFVARDGCITGLLGPNGAGKSTCLRILSTVLRPDSGNVRVGGIDAARDPLAVRRLIGVLPDGAGLYPNLTGRENIAYFARLHGIERRALAERADRLLDRLDLADAADRRAKGYSHGERTKVALARALVHEPAHVLLDEPTNGLDVLATRELRQWLKELRNEGRCILLSSHVMQEVAALADDVIIIAAGRVVASGSAEELSRRFPQKNLEEIFVAAVSGAEK